MTKRTFRGCIMVSLALCICALTTRAQNEPSTGRAFLDKYCAGCHNERLKTAGLLLDKTDLTRIGEHGQALEKVVKKFRAGEMPPAGAPQPEKATLDSFVTWLEQSLDNAAVAKPNPGRAAIHRLNRAEYINAVRDLLAIDTDAIDMRSLLPPDDSGYGFDNIGD